MSGSVIKTVYVLYKAITEQLKKGNDEVVKSNEKVTKSIKSVKDYSDQVVNQLKSFAKEIVFASGAIYSASELVGAFKDSINFGRELSVTSNLLNINAEELQAWGNALEHVGGDAKSFQSNIQSLGSYFNIRADRAIKLLPVLAEAFQKLNPQQATILGQNYGLSPDFILFLRKGPEEISKILNLQKEFGVITQEQTDNFGKLNDNIINAKNASKGLFLAVANDSLPVLNSAFDNITKSLVFLRHHLKDFESGLEGIGVGIVGAVSVMVPPIGALAAAILAVVAAYKAWDALNFSSIVSSGNFLASNISLGNSLSDFNNQVNQPIATQPSSNVRNSTNNVNYTQNNNFGDVVTKDSKDFYRQISNPGNASQAFVSWQAQNQVSSGVQA